MNKKMVFDIETAAATKTLDDLPNNIREQYIKKYQYKADGDNYAKYGALDPCFGRVVCISFQTDEETSPRSVWGLDEKELLLNFKTQLSDINPNIFIGHNIKGFDIPYINVRFAANNIPIHHRWKTYGVKPWDLVHIVDTLDIWRGGLYSAPQSGSMDTVCRMLGIPTPKDNMSGGDVYEKFYSGQIKDIVDYCEKDVAATVQVYKRLKELGWI
jgi:predicted PolB exonuclease-like 3'-5' exonuclease